MPVKMKALRSFHGAGEGRVKRGREFAVRDEQRAKELEAHGLAFRVKEKVETKPQNKMEPPPENKASRDGPLPSVGGPIGAATPLSSLLPDHPRPARRSRRSRA